MIELSMYCILGVYIAIWLSMFLQAFALGSGRNRIHKWGWLCLLIGWIGIVSLSSPTGVIEELHREITTWDWVYGGTFITLFFVSSLGSGYLCGWLHYIQTRQKRR
jgi:LytS/YehU family sensor histidine kinase